MSVDLRDPEVLAWVNQMRATLALGEPLDMLPDATRPSGYDCPIARALRVGSDGPVRYVGKVNVQLVGAAASVSFPASVRRWIAAFDATASAPQERS